jgi:protein involved in polysaccharide export with SLBB domain
MTLTIMPAPTIFGAVRQPPLALALLLLAAPLAAQQPAATSTSINGSGYHLRPGDIVRVTVWGQEAYSGQFEIDERGILEYPGLGEINATDLTVLELRDKIRKGLENVFNSPYVTVHPQFRMAVLGSVEKPGLYTVDPTLSVLDVVAMAGGPGSGGNLNKVKLLRDGREMQLRLQGGIKGHTLEEIGVRSGDEIIVPHKFFSRDNTLLFFQIVQIAVSVVLLVKLY